MKLERLLIANRGEIAIRIAEAAAAAGMESVAVFAEDDGASLHRYRADRAVALSGTGAGAYLDAAQLVAVAQAEGCDAVHPGYGFLSEDPAFASACTKAGLTFVGPPPEALALFADKASARRLAEAAGVPVIEGSAEAVTIEEAEAFLAALEPGAAMMIKAVAGGGGRGMRIVRERGAVAAAYAAASAEAESAFGNGALFVERFLPAARHVEIQVVADAAGAATHLGERECSLQRRHQKLVEIAPCPGMTPVLRERIAEAALRLARAAGYRNIGTFEFLVDAAALAATPDDAPFWFMEANPRIQVEHTVTEAVTGVDLVQTQLAIAAGARLADIGLDIAPRLSGHAIQARINLETMDAEGTARPAAGTIERYEMPSGPGVRVDGYGYAGFTASPRYDGLLAKLIVHAPGPFGAALAKARRALAEARVTGVDTNIAFLRALLDRTELAEGAIDTRFVDRTLPALVEAAGALGAARLAPVAAHAPKAAAGQAMPEEAAPGCVLVSAPMQGLVAELLVAQGTAVTAGETLAVVEAMKMMHPIEAPVAGVVRRIGVAAGAIVAEGEPMIEIALGEDSAAGEVAARTVDLEAIPPQLAELEARRALGLDAARADAVAKRHAIGHRTARENIADLTDPGSFVEYGPLAIAAQTRRRSEDDLIRNTQADGIVTGTATVNAAQFGAEAGRCAVLAYDYMTLAGTQGHRTHHKMDRLFGIAERNRLPVVLFSEGGGGRPGDIDVQYVTGLQVASFQMLARLSGLVPLIGINAGRCFAGNAALLGCCDVIIATRDSSIGMGGPAMIEGGGLGRYHPDEVGPTSVQVPNGVIDILVEDEAEAVAVAKRYIGYFQGPLATWEAADQRLLRHALPEDRARSYDIRALIATLADADSVLEIRRGYGAGIVTALARIEGRPVGIIANNPLHLGGAIDAPAADKASRFFQLLDAHDIPLLSLCDTPGFMVGPESEKAAPVRRFARLFVTAAGMDIPVMTIVLRKAYGLGAMAMMAGQSQAPEFTVAWPAGEFGGMGLEGAIRLGLRKELEAIEDPERREAYFREQVAAAYRWGRAANAASHFEIDDVIDPADSRRWIRAALDAVATRPPRSGRKRAHIDTW
jgi:acetyl/propionyl-CoA carboxylase alpha subunit/acetyl-CoA carboxylase carboxyltransferase component